MPRSYHVHPDRPSAYVVSDDNNQRRRLKARGWSRLRYEDVRAGQTRRLLTAETGAYILNPDGGLCRLRVDPSRA